LLILSQVKNILIANVFIKDKNKTTHLLSGNTKNEKDKEIVYDKLTSNIIYKRRITYDYISYITILTD